MYLHQIALTYDLISFISVCTAVQTTITYPTQPLPSKRSFRISLKLDNVSCPSYCQIKTYFSSQSTPPPNTAPPPCRESPSAATPPCRESPHSPQPPFSSFTNGEESSRLLTAGLPFGYYCGPRGEAHSWVDAFEKGFALSRSVVSLKDPSPSSQWQLRSGNKNTGSSRKRIPVNDPFDEMLLPEYLPHKFLIFLLTVAYNSFSWFFRFYWTNFVCRLLPLKVIALHLHHLIKQSTRKITQFEYSQ